MRCVPVGAGIASIVRFVSRCFYVAGNGVIPGLGIRWGLGRGYAFAQIASTEPPVQQVTNLSVFFEKVNVSRPTEHGQPFPSKACWR
jgi:hypothetical protein